MFNMDDRTDRIEFDDPEPDLDRYDSALRWNGESSPDRLTLKTRKQNPRMFNEPEMLLARPASDWVDIAVRTPPSGQLFGPFWRDEELSVMFGGTGTGKSVLAIQIAESLARGFRLPPFAEDNLPECEPQRVLYLDFELNLRQFATRYAIVESGEAAFGSRYEFSRNLVRAEMYWNGQVLEGYSGFSDMFFSDLANLVAANEITAVVVDNITFLDRASTSNANTALNIMRSLQHLKQEQLISILVIAHTPKRRPWMPLTELDLQGSINLANFADSIFAIGRSRVSPDIRYLKQVKTRSGRPEHTADNVLLFSLEKFDFAACRNSNEEGREERRDFLGFRFIGFAGEDEHLDKVQPELTDARRRHKYGRDVVRHAKKLANEGMNKTRIAATLGIPRSTVRRYLVNA
jgi:hypothetical protein